MVLITISRLDRADRLIPLPENGCMSDYHSSIQNANCPSTSILQAALRAVVRRATIVVRSYNRQAGWRASSVGQCVVESAVVVSTRENTPKLAFHTVHKPNHNRIIHTVSHIHQLWSLAAAAAAAERVMV